MKLIELQPGDTLVLKCPMAITKQAHVALSEYFRQYVPDGVGLLIIDSGMDIDVVRSNPPLHESKR